jgi:response regulator RpfG family c-di-GMP phosphodiesterase
MRLLLTGYADTEAVMGAINDGEVHRFLQKPWDNAALRDSVEQAVLMGASLRRSAADAAGAAPEAIAGAAAPSLPDRAASPAPAASPSSTGAQIVHFPPNERARENRAAEPQRENVLIVERAGRLHGELSGAAGENFALMAARSIPEASELMKRDPSRVIVFVLDAQSPFERSFLKLLKIEHPGIIVIAVCEALDTTHMIELINHARIFRFLLYPVSPQLLMRHLKSAAALARQLHEQPLLMGTQKVALDGRDAAAALSAVMRASAAQEATPAAPPAPAAGTAASGWRARLIAWLQRG